MTVSRIKKQGIDYAAHGAIMRLTHGGWQDPEEALRLAE